MSLKIPVKAGAISNLTDARFFAAYGVDMLGFCFDPQSENYISPHEALAIKGWISGPQIVAEFKNQDAENVRNIIAFLQPEIIQIGNSLYREFINTEDLKIIIDLRDADVNILLADIITSELISFLVTESQYLNNKSNLLKNAIVELTTSSDLLLYPAIQINGTHESETGIKSFEWEADILERLV
ncbi:MAG: hypothetical protein ACK4IY_00830 [Chitinophagales bacterium]